MQRATMEDRAGTTEPARTGTGEQEAEQASPTRAANPPSVGLADVKRGEALSLLATEHVGRLAVVVDGKPEIYPVNYAVAEDGTVIVRTEDGTKLTASEQAWVAFEVDHVDHARKLGWSVVVQGRAFDVTAPLDHRSDALRRLAVESWAPGPPHHVLAISPERVSGRRLVVTPRLASRRPTERSSTI